MRHHVFTVLMVVLPDTTWVGDTITGGSNNLSLRQFQCREQRGEVKAELGSTM